EGHDHADIVIGIGVDLLLRLRLGPVQPRGRHIPGRHAGRIIDHDDVVAAAPLAAMDSKAHGAVDASQKDQKLQEQQHVLSKPLQQAIDVQVLDALLPQKSARHAQRPSLELEEIEQDYGERNEEKYKRSPPGHEKMKRQMETALQPVV